MRVLLAEDEESIAVTLRDALEEAGHEVLSATDTDQALSLLETHDPDVVLTDIRMPGAGGMSVLERSLALDEHRCVVLMTGYATVEQAVEAMRIGAANYIQKPFRNEAVVGMLERLARDHTLGLAALRSASIIACCAATVARSIVRSSSRCIIT